MYSTQATPRLQIDIMDKCTGIHQKTCVRVSQSTIHSGQSLETAHMSIIRRMTKTLVYSYGRKLVYENENKLQPHAKKVWKTVTDVTLRERSQSQKRL